MLAAGIVDGTAGRDGSGMFASRPDSRRFEGLPRSWRDAVLDQQIAAATRVTDNCDPPVGQKHLALVPSDPFGSRIRVFDPGILGVIAHRSSSPRSFGHAYDRQWNPKQSSVSVHAQRGNSSGSDFEPDDAGRPSLEAPTVRERRNDL